MRAAWVAFGLLVAGLVAAPAASAGCAYAAVAAVCHWDTDGDGRSDYAYAAAAGTNACVWAKTWAPDCRVSTPAGTVTYQALHREDRTVVTAMGESPWLAWRVLAYDHDADHDGHREAHAQAEVYATNVGGTGYGTGCEPGAGRTAC